MIQLFKIQLIDPKRLHTYFQTFTLLLLVSHLYLSPIGVELATSACRHGRRQLRAYFRYGNHSPPSQSRGPPMSLQLPFKTGPALPHTTREDANSVMLSDLGLARRLREVTGTLNQSATPGPTDDTIAEAEGEKLPKVISYRKKLPQQPLPDRDNAMYDEEHFASTKYRLALMRRNVEFHQTFKQLDLTDRLLDDYSCAMLREILLQGRLYILGMYVCFNSNLLGWVTNLVIKMDEIVNIERKLTAGLFPNGIAIDTENNKYTFASFILRDATFDLLVTAWHLAGGPPKRLLDTSSSSTESAATANSEPKLPRIENYLMLLDGDDNTTTSDELMMLAPDTKTRKFNKTCGFSNHGPDTHAPTEPEIKPIDKEIVLFDETIDAPLGVTFAVLFDQNTTFHRQFLEDHDGLEFTEYSAFDPETNTRAYTYQKALNYSIGPKLTRCEVVETIYNLDYDGYIEVELVTRTPDVPLGNSFAVHTRYILSWGDDNSTDFRLLFYIKWTGSSWIKGMIEKLSLSGQQAAADDLLKALRKEIDQDTYVTGAADDSGATKPLADSAKVSEKVTTQPSRHVTTTTTTVRHELSGPLLAALTLVVLMITVLLVIEWQNYIMLRETMKLMPTEKILVMRE